MRHATSHVVDDYEDDSLEDIATLLDFHACKDVSPITDASKGDAVLSSSPRLDREASIFSQSETLKRKKPLHVYGRKSTSKTNLVDSPGKPKPSLLVAFRKLLEESASEQDIEDSSPAPAKRQKVIDVRPEKELRRERTVSDGIENGKKAPLLAVAGTSPLQRQAAAANMEDATKQKRQYQFRRPFPLHTTRKAHAGNAEGGGNNAGGSRVGLDLVAEATEVIEEYTDTSGLARQDSARNQSDTMILTADDSGRSRLQRNGRRIDPLDSLPNAQASNTSSDVQDFDDWNFDTGPLQAPLGAGSPHISTVEDARPSRAAEQSVSASSLQLPTAGQRAAATSYSTETSRSAFSRRAPNITLTTATSPPRAIGTSDIASSPMAIVQAQTRPTPSGQTITVATFLKLVIPPKLARPPPPPNLPFRRMSKPLEPAPILHTFVPQADLEHGGPNNDGYLGVGRRGWWTLPLLTRNTVSKSDSAPSTGIILGLEDSSHSPIVGTITWTLPRLALLFKQIAAMSATRKWGMLDIFPSPVPNDLGHVHIRIVCPASLALQLRTVLSEMACRLDLDGHEMDLPPGADVEEGTYGKMWLSPQTGVKLAWWDEMERIPVLLA